MIDLVIKNGLVVTETGEVLCDVGIKDGRIVALGDSSLWSDAARVIDAAGKYVVPGMIDSHTHISSPGEFPSLDDYHSGTVAAAYGGTTTFVDFSFVLEGETPRAALERKLDQAKGKCVVDYAFHPCINSADEQSFRDIDELLEEGFSSIKMFTVYRDSLMLEAGGIARVMDSISRHGGIAMVHAENADMIEYLIRRDRALGHTSVRYHPQSRPTITETTAIAEVIEMARQAQAPVAIAHVSTGRAADLIRSARARGQHVYAETCPHYLILSEEVYNQENGCDFVCNPPIRSAEDRRLLWDMVIDGGIDLVNSDHTDFSHAQKRVYRQDYSKIPGGLPSVETRGMALFSEGVATGRMSLSRFVELTSTNTAKLMGLYSSKGRIALGSDADIAIIDPRREWICRASELHMRTDYCPYEGRSFTGRVDTTIVRGHVVVDGGAYVEDGFRGMLQKRYGYVAL